MTFTADFYKLFLGYHPPLERNNPPMSFDHAQLKNLNVIKIWGKVTRIVGLVIEGYCPHSSIGSLCELTTIDGEQKIYC